jgi:hypothetical protein
MHPGPTQGVAPQHPWAPIGGCIGQPAGPGMGALASGAVWAIASPAAYASGEASALTSSPAPWSSLPESPDVNTTSGTEHATRPPRHDSTPLNTSALMLRPRSS